MEINEEMAFMYQEQLKEQYLAFDDASNQTLGGEKDRA